MFSNNKKKVNISGKLFIIAIIGLFIYGYVLDEENVNYLKNLYPNDKDISQTEDENTDLGQTNEDNDADNANTSQIDPIRETQNQKTISNNTKFICKTFNKSTNEITTDQLELPNELINMSIDDAKQYIGEHYANWIINEINEQYIEVYKTSESTNYEPYFLIKESNNKIYVYEFNESGEKKMILETNINFDLLRETDQDLFKKGIVKYDMNEVNEMLQDFES